MARKKASAKSSLDPTREYVLSESMLWRMVTREHVEVRVYGDAVRMPLAWYLIVLKLARPTSLERAAAAYGVDLGDHPEIRRMFQQLAGAGVIRPHDQRAKSSSDESIVDLLDPAVYATPNRKQIAAALRAGRLVVIPNAFRKQIADEAHRDLSTCTEWQPYERFYPGFFYHHHNLYDPFAFPPALCRLHAAFASKATRDFMTELSGKDCSGEPAFAAGLYLPGDHSLPHDDDYGQRTVAYVWHLTRDWQPAWGGDFHWMPTNVSLPPSFNTLLLFTVSTKKSNHFVTTVSPYAQSQRFAINGWWQGAHARKEKPQRRATKRGRSRRIAIY